MIKMGKKKNWRERKFYQTSRHHTITSHVAQSLYYSQRLKSILPAQTLDLLHIHSTEVAAAPLLLGPAMVRSP